MMYRISELCKEFNLSRSTLLYYDGIGLLQASARTLSNYRLYSEEDRLRLRQICMYREAGVALDDIKGLLHSDEQSKTAVLENRLVELNHDMQLLRLQQKIILCLLKDKDQPRNPAILDKNTFVSILKSSGVNEASLDGMHREFERKSPSEHQAFLEFLGIAEQDIRKIRDAAK